MFDSWAVAAGVLTVCTFALPILGWRLGMVRGRRHLPFLFIYVESAIYLFAAPLAVLLGRTVPLDGTRQLYVVLEVGCLLLFNLPFYAVYAFVARRWLRTPEVRYAGAETKGQPGPDRPRMVASRAFWLALIAVAGSVVYMVLLSNAGLLFRRIGSTGLASAYVNLGGVQFAMIRGFDRLYAPMLALLCLAAMRYRGLARRWLFGALLVAGGIDLAVVGVSSRLGIVLALAIVLVPVIVRGGPIGARSRPALAAVGLALVVIAYFWSVTSNVRTNFVATGLVSVSQLNPFAGSPTASLNDLPVDQRLDCVNLMALMTPRAAAAGFDQGHSWIPPLVSSIPVLDPKAAAVYKASVATTAKYYLITRYTNLAVADYPSCALTDAYGNLGPAGFLACAVVLGLLSALVTRWLAADGWQLVIALVLFADVAYFENEFIAVAVSLVAYLPALILLLILNPLRSKRGGPGGSATVGTRLPDNAPPLPV